MILERNTVRVALLLTAATLAGAGCSGINTSQSVSPATFLMPGLFGQTQPPAPAFPSALPIPPQESVQTLAHAK